MNLNNRTLPKPQRLHQFSERSCGVSVFAALAEIAEADVLRDLPGAELGTITVDGWIQWLRGKGFEVLKREGCPNDIVPCAHLVGHGSPRDRSDFHWIYRDADGDVHDPSPVAMYMPADDPRMREIAFYSERVLTISVSRI